MSCIRFASATLFCFLIALATRFAGGEDHVWLEPPRPTSTESDWYPRGIEKISGQVIDLDARQLRLIRSGDEAETVIAARRVLWIDPEIVSELEAEAIEHFVNKRYRESLSKLPDILQQRPPVWRQQWITMLAANAAWKSGRGKISLELVSQLDRRPLPLFAVAWLPVAWRGGVQPPDALSEAKNRLSDPSPAVRLIAASWLLSSPDRSQAAAALNQLQTDDRREIAQLAEVLLWRMATPPTVIQSAVSWRTKIGALPMVLQAGPTKTLIDKLRSAGQSELAKRLQWSLELTPIHPFLE